MGVERIAIFEYGIENDIRTFYENDIPRFFRTV